MAGSVTAFTVSTINTVRAAGQVYFDTATMLPVLVTFGKIMEATAKRKAADLLHAMESLLPASALKIETGTAVEVAIEQLHTGDLVLIRPGERIAVDGLIHEGNSTVEEAAFTGEPLPVCRGPGERVLAGTVNGQGSLLVKTEQAGKEVLLQRIVTMIQGAWQNPSPAERIAERAAGMFIVLVGLVALASLILWTLADNPLQGFLSALSVLVVACPCTMGIATPLATSLAIARAATAGIVVRGGETMEQLGRTDLIFFDKTGTLTTNQPVLREIIVFDPQLTEDRLLALLATLESASKHPLARTISAEAARRGLELGSPAGINIYPGQGIDGLVKLNGESRMITAGASASFRQTVDSAGGEGLMAMDVAWDGHIRGRLVFEDGIRSDAVATVQKLDTLGIPSVILSGDRLQVASAIAAQAGIRTIEAPRNPVEKLAVVEQALDAGRKVAVVGDGVNDAAPLAAAQVGIALGSGLDLARQAGNVVILSDRLTQIPWLIGLSRQTRRIIGQNFAWSFGYNAIALGAAAAGLLHPLLAAIAMVVSSLTVLANSLRISSFPGEEM
ncbi:heavy metal translocating P-type ATPase [Geotalea toluenoxydans]|uniref:heavy metal translocating P-type ATPase n=1 Tax=Geotalea toluenoxydans TaxID=421624 RepID=UPI0006D2B61E|nr:cation-translocating P-type ATPase [Geotalea toluenoxydans]